MDIIHFSVKDFFYNSGYIYTLFAVQIFFFSSCNLVETIDFLNNSGPVIPNCICYYILKYRTSKRTNIFISEISRKPLICIVCRSINRSTHIFELLLTF